MRYGLLADVHANLAALEAAVAALRADGAERFVCAGDIVGYGPQPNECIDTLRSLDAVCVAGNHELIALGRLTESGIHPWALRTLQWTRGALSPAARRWLEELPVRADMPEGITVAHGALDDARTYVKSEEQVREQLARVGDARVLVLGHTHVQMTMTDGGKLFVNPGAVGQTRERRIRAAAATLKLDTGSVQFVSVPYDTRATRRELIRNGLPRSTYRLRPSPARRVWLRLPLGLRAAVKRMLGRGA